MMTIEIPRREPDGSFVLDVMYLTKKTNKLSRTLLNNWIFSWVKSNSPWERCWSSGKIEQLNFYDDFQEVPFVSDISSEYIKMRMLGTKDGIYWKDWLVRWTKDLMLEFDDIVKFIGTKNSNDQ